MVAISYFVRVTEIQLVDTNEIDSNIDTNEIYSISRYTNVIKTWNKGDNTLSFTMAITDVSSVLLSYLGNFT